MYCSLIPDKQAQAVRENPLLSCPAELVLTRSSSGVPPITADWSPVRHHSLKLPADRNTPRIAMKTTLALLLASALMAGVSGRGPLVTFTDPPLPSGFPDPPLASDFPDPPLASGFPDPPLASGFPDPPLATGIALLRNVYANHRNPSQVPDSRLEDLAKSHGCVSGNSQIQGSWQNVEILNTYSSTASYTIACNSQMIQGWPSSLGDLEKIYNNNRVGCSAPTNCDCALCYYVNV